jgi:hypothetical protein
MADLCPCSPIGGRRCRKTCQSCTKKPCGSGCPGQPNIKKLNQGIVMSGAGAPPHTACEPAPPAFPKPKCFLFNFWYDFSQNQFYALRRSTTGQIISYDRFDCGEQILNLFRLTTPGNIAAQGTVIASGPVLDMVDCLVPRANEAIAYSSINTNALAYSVANANAAVAAARVAKTIASANMGVMGFVYGNPPTPSVIASIRGGQGFTTTPTIVLTPREFGFVVYVRDSRTGLYFRDPNNSPLTDPDFPENPCNGDVHDQREFNLRFQFNSETCQWYLIGFACPLSSGCDALNQGLMASGVCPIAENWRDNCTCACGEKQCCGECEKDEVEIVERIVKCREDKSEEKDCGFDKKKKHHGGRRGARNDDAGSFSLVSSGGGSSSSSTTPSSTQSGSASSASSRRDSLLSSSAIVSGENGDDDSLFSD